MLLNNIKLSIRSLNRDKKFVLLNILGMSIGLCIFMLIALFVYNELTVDTYYPKSSSLYRLVENNDNAGLDYQLSNVLASEYPEIEKSCPVYQSSESEFSLESPNIQFKTKLFMVLLPF